MPLKRQIGDIMKVSIIMLTHNAMRYVYQSIHTIAKNTEDIDYELIVFDNASFFLTKLLLRFLKWQHKIDKVIFHKENALFAKGNNLAADHIARDSDYLLLLNSDIKVRNKVWLKKLVELCPSGGIASLGAVEYEPVRADGYCMLIDKNLFLRYKLDEEFAWFWSVTKLQGQTLGEGKKVIAVKNHEELLHHYGGKSGKAFMNAKGMGTDINEVKRWFENHRITVIDGIDY